MRQARRPVETGHQAVWRRGRSSVAHAAGQGLGESDQRALLLRADICRDFALKAGSAAVLGDDVARFLGPVTLPRALELMQGATPADAVEQDLARRIGQLESLRELA
jgi:hypothetical protein